MTSRAVDHADHGEPADAGDLSRKLVRQLAAAAGTRYALFGTIDDERQAVDAIAVWDGEGFLDGLRYELAGTPCADVVSKGLCVYPHDVISLFPDDQMLAELRIESYAGMPVRDGAGVPRAIVAVFDTGEIDAGAGDSHARGVRRAGARRARTPRCRGGARAERTREGSRALVPVQA